MFPRTKNRKAISTVLTTLIILVASVVLGTGVVLYGTSLFQTNSQSQSIETTGVKVWADKGGSGWAWGAADIRNDGDKLLSVDQISIRGTAVPFGNWYVDTNQSEVTTTNFQQALNYTSVFDAKDGAISNGTALDPTSEGIPVPTHDTTCSNTSGFLIMALQSQSTAGYHGLCLQQATGPLSLAPGARAIVYFEVPQNVLTTVDAGSSGAVAIYAGNVGAPQTVTIASQ
jgi:hypothetical protein